MITEWILPSDKVEYLFPFFHVLKVIWAHSVMQSSFTVWNIDNKYCEVKYEVLDIFTIVNFQRLLRVKSILRLIFNHFEKIFSNVFILSKLDSQGRAINWA